MSRLPRSIALCAVVGAFVPACDAAPDEPSFRNAVDEACADTGDLPPPLSGKFEIIDPRDGRHVANLEFTVGDDGRITDSNGNEWFHDEHGCIENWSFTGTSERGTPVRLDWNIEEGWWDITNATSTPRALVPG
jgi:hypothetical protein